MGITQAAGVHSRRGVVPGLEAHTAYGERHPAVHVRLGPPKHVSRSPIEGIPSNARRGQTDN